MESVGHIKNLRGCVRAHSRRVDSEHVRSADRRVLEPVVWAEGGTNHQLAAQHVEARKRLTTCGRVDMNPLAPHAT
jgi:hypothetical protein